MKYNRYDPHFDGLLKRVQKLREMSAGNPLIEEVVLLMEDMILEMEHIRKTIKDE